MIAALSDALADTSAVAVDVGQHMVWSYQSFHNQKDRSFFSPADTEQWAMLFQQQSELITPPESQ